jgi:hypothetical protein
MLFVCVSLYYNFLLGNLVLCSTFNNIARQRMDELKMKKVYVGIAHILSANGISRYRLINVGDGSSYSYVHTYFVIPCFMK